MYLLTCYVHVFVVDVCSNNDCHYNADCIPKDNSYTCTCRQGYDGSGYECQGQIIIYQFTMYSDSDLDISMVV